MKTKVPLIVFSTDWHIVEDNIETIKDLVRQQCELAVKLGVKYLACLGDVFTSRIAQKETVLNAFPAIVDIVHEHGLELWVIPGNHDKTNYGGVPSFLSPSKYRPGLRLIEMAGSIPFPEYNLSVDFQPFFKEDIWLEYFACFEDHVGEIPAEYKRILCTHIAVTGSRNNDGSMVSSKLSTKLFDNYFKVFSGHYHDMQTIGKNFYHIPSIQQNNFGENANKGFTVLYSDGSHELIKSNFKEYVKVQIDIDEIDAKELNVFKELYANNDKNIRFELKGSENKLKSIKKEDFTALGIDVKMKTKEVENDIVFSESAEVVEHTQSTIMDKFAEFCKQDGLDLETGIKYLNRKFKKE